MIDVVFAEIEILPADEYNYENKGLQTGYEPDRDRLIWGNWDIHCGQGMDVLLPDRIDGGTWQVVSFEYNDEGWYMPRYPGVFPVGLWARESKDGLKVSRRL